MSLVVRHGGAALPSVVIDSYNAAIKDGDGFLGDRASNRAFRAGLDEVRARVAAGGEDVLGPEPAADMKKSELDRLLKDGTPQQSAILHTAIEAFAGELALVVRRFLKQPKWRGTQRLVLGGGLSDSRVGRLAIGRAQLLLKEAGIPLELLPIRHHPDEGGLLGGAHLAPSWIFKGHDSLLAMDIGGTNLRAGLVVLHQKRAPDLSRAEVEGLERWRHRDDKPTREQTMERIVEMLQGLIRRAEKAGHSLAPFVAVGCPGQIAADGRIERGGQNLPGNWEHERFNLAERLLAAIPRIGPHRTHVVVHNDAVVQGLSEVPFMQDVERWGVMTIGTGLGNARFSNRG